MSDKKKLIDKSRAVELNEDRGLSPVSSGTPMPKVKPAKPVEPTTGQKQNNNGSSDES